MISVKSKNNLLNSLLNKYFHQVGGAIACKFCDEKMLPDRGEIGLDDDFSLSKFCFRHVRMHGSRDELDILRTRWEKDVYILCCN